VDNGSEDGSVDFVRLRYPEVNIMALSRNTGFCGGNNAALRQTESEYVALLNNDAVPHPLWLHHLVDALDGCREAGFAASRMLFRDSPSVVDRAGDAYTVAGAGLLRGRGMEAGRFARREWIFGACGGAAFYRMGMLRDVGWFDEDFFLLYEDVDLSFRAQLKGYRCLYVPEAVVYHAPGSTIQHDSGSSVYYGHRNLEWVFAKNMPVGLLAVTLPFHLLYVLSSFAYFAASGRIRDFLRAKRDALRGLGAMLGKRRRIQREKRVGSGYVWRLMEKELLLPRLTRRMGRTGRPGRDRYRH